MSSTAERRVDGDYKFAHWIGLYLSFHLSRVSSLLVRRRLKNPKTYGHFWPWLNSFNIGLWLLVHAVEFLRRYMHKPQAVLNSRLHLSNHSAMETFL